jgi:stress-induced morphogen
METFKYSDFVQNLMTLEKNLFLEKIKFNEAVLKETKKWNAMFGPDNDSNTSNLGATILLTQSSDLTSQIETIPTLAKTFQCKICCKDFQSKSGRQKHIQKKHQKNGFDCKFCFNKHTQKESLKSNACIKHFFNQESIHESNASNLSTIVPISQRYECNICLKQFKHKKLVNRHIREKHEGIHYNCSICSKEFNRKYLVNRHIKAVHGI